MYFNRCMVSLRVPPRRRQVAMPTRPPHACAQPGCGALVYGSDSRCEQHRLPHWNIKDNRERDAIERRYGTQKWSSLRAAVLRREPMCRACRAQGRYVAATVVDHIVPVRDGGRMYDWFNLQPLCVACHNAKHLQMRKVRNRDGTEKVRESRTTSGRASFAHAATN